MEIEEFNQSVVRLDLENDKEFKELINDGIIKFSLSKVFIKLSLESYANI